MPRLTPLIAFGLLLASAAHAQTPRQRATPPMPTARPADPVGTIPRVEPQQAPAPAPSAAPAQPPAAAQAASILDTLDKVERRHRLARCGAEWQKMKAAGSDAGLVWRDFSVGCLQRP